MKAIRFHPPGGPENLHLEHLPIPEPTEPGQFLVKVAYASIIATELTWPIYQDGNGSYHPATPCHDYAGTVVAVSGSGFEGTGIEVGSEVMCFPNEWKGTGLRYQGGLAEYALADVKSAVLKPKGLRMVDAASVPLSALTAWQGLFDQPDRPLGQGDRLLVTGAAGSTGTWAVQFGKQVGAYVIGTASSEWSKKTLQEIGCDEIVDYKTQNPLSTYVKEVDLVLDTVGGDATLAELPKVLKEDGQVVSIVTYDIQQRLADVKAKFFIWTQNVAQMRKIAGMIEKGELKTFVDSVFPLEQAAEAFRKGMGGHLQGKVVVEAAGEKASGKM
jgi:NADPH:quinone reductase-like Zn-dependent oxidoreductase